MNAFLISGLVKRRAQLAGDIEKARDRVEAIRPKAVRLPKDWCGTTIWMELSPQQWEVGRQSRIHDFVCAFGIF